MKRQKDGWIYEIKEEKNMIPVLVAGAALAGLGWLASSSDSKDKSDEQIIDAILNEELGDLEDDIRQLEIDAIENIPESDDD